MSDGVIRIALSDQAVEAIADQVAQRVATMLATGTQADAWLTTAEAAKYLGLTVDALHKRTSARDVPFRQEKAGGKLWFRRSELDRWRDDSK